MERVNQIIDILFSHGEVALTQIADILQVSASTVRREILQNNDSRIELIKNHVKISRVIDISDISVHRLPVDQNEIRAIANYAVQIIQQGDVIAISGGQICAEVALRLKFYENITVVTNAINVVAELVGIPSINIMVTGGVLNSESFELVGDSLRCSLENIHINKFFLGTDGLSIDHGVTGHDLREAKSAQIIKEFSDNTYILADSSKFEKANFARVCGIEELTAIITTDATSKKIIEQIESKTKIPCLIAELNHSKYNI